MLHTIRATICGIDLEFKTSPRLFSPRHVDKGTLAMLSVVEANHSDMVTKRRTWYRNKMISVFGGVRIHEVDGYYVFSAVKTQHDYASLSRNRLVKS